MHVRVFEMTRNIREKSKHVEAFAATPPAKNITCHVHKNVNISVRLSQSIRTRLDSKWILNIHNFNVTSLCSVILHYFGKTFRRLSTCCDDAGRWMRASKKMFHKC